MTLSELLAILKLDECIVVPSTLADMKIVNSEEFCRLAEMNYFKSDTFNIDIIYMLDELVSVFDENLVSLQDFDLSFKNDSNGDLHLQLTAHCL